MKKTAILVLAIVMLFSLAACTADPAPVPVVTPAPMTVEPDPTTQPTVEPNKTYEGTVLYFDSTQLELFQKDNSGSFAMTADKWPTITFFGDDTIWGAVTLGDDISVTYTGELSDTPEVVKIDVLKVNTDLFTIPVTVSSIEPKYIDPKNANHYSGGIYGTLADSEEDYFLIDSNESQFTVGLSYEDMQVGQTYLVTYRGDKAELATVKTIANVPAPTPAPAPLANKSLMGTVTAYKEGKSFTVVTQKSNSYSFRITGDTNITGKHSMGEGVYIKVSYSGNASDMPDAVKITVVSNRPPVVKVRGIIQSLPDLTLINPDYVMTVKIGRKTYNVDFDPSHCQMRGDDPEVMASVVIQFYAVDGLNPIIAQIITVSTVRPPDPDPDPTEDPNNE